LVVLVDQKICNGRELLELCFKVFFWHANFETFVINASASWHKYTCSRSVHNREYRTVFTCTVPLPDISLF